MNKEALISFLRVVKHHSFRNGYRYRGFQYEEAHVLANGPSINESISSINFEGKVLFVLNNFARSHDLFTRLKPQNYVFADPAFWDSDMEEPVLMDIVHLTSWDINVYLPFEIYRKEKVQKFFSSNIFIHLIPYNKTYIEGFGDWQVKAYMKNYGTPITANVLVATLFLAINSGAQNIHIYGADHTWTKSIIVNDSNQVCIADTHFNSETKFYPWLKHDNTPFLMSEILEAFARMFRGYEYIEKYAKRIGVRIINETPGSFIDSFERSKK